MNNAAKEGDVVTATIEGDNNVDITIDEVTWRIRVTLLADAICLCDAETGEHLYRGKLFDIGISEPGDLYALERRDREGVLIGFVAAWIVLQPRH